MMTLSQALSNQGIEATIESAEYGKERYKENFKSATVKRLLKSGYWADIEEKDGTIHKLRVKKNGKLTVFNCK